jgi:deazaflavin-dependent oxidoreductase (nitroreductase family)
MDDRAPAWATEDFCYVTTVGRRSGNAHTIEIWFGYHDGKVYILAGNPESDWVRNIRANPRVEVRVGDETWSGTGREVPEGDEQDMARRLLAGKYQAWREGKPLSQWARTARPMSIEPQS